MKKLKMENSSSTTAYKLLSPNEPWQSLPKITPQGDGGGLIAAISTDNMGNYIPVIGDNGGVAHETNRILRKLTSREMNLNVSTSGTLATSSSTEKESVIISNLVIHNTDPASTPPNGDESGAKMNTLPGRTTETIPRSQDNGKNDKTLPSETSVSTLMDDDDEFIVLPGPDDIFIFNSTDGLYHQSVTLTARMWPPVEAGHPSTVWGLPVIIWAILIGFLIIAFLIVATLFFCCWLLPRKRKFLSPTRYCTTSPLAHRASVVAKPWNDSGHIIVPMSIGLVPPQYSAPPAPPPPVISSNHNSLEYPSSPGYGASISPGESKYSIPETHKSMWAINPLYASSTVLSETDAAYKSRSLPSWGKSKQRPVSTTDDLDELYAKVNFSKKRRNRMRNDEAAIIALCRSRSQNLAGLPLEREGVVIYDERTAL